VILQATYDKMKDQALRSRSNAFILTDGGSFQYSTCTAAFAADFTGRVVGISDGDTISMMHGTRAEKIRLNGLWQGCDGEDLWQRKYGPTLNEELIRAGLAWWYEKYSKDTKLRDVRQEARIAKRGLWVYPDPVFTVGVAASPGTSPSRKTLTFIRTHLGV
jgi:endonuclease YncB( thermonuclease family)